MRRVLVDTGFLVSVYDRSEPLHSRCLKVYEGIEEQLVTCEAVITEAIHILRNEDSIRGILESVENGSLQIPFSLSQSATKVAELMDKYSDTPAEFADACLVCMADELDTGDILTLDSDFRHYRWRRNRQFRLLIPLD